MPLNVASTHSPRVERQDLVVEAFEASAVLRDDLGREGAPTIPRNADVDGTGLGLDGFGAMAVTAISRAASLDLVWLVAQVG